MPGKLLAEAECSITLEDEGFFTGGRGKDFLVGAVEAMGWPMAKRADPHLNELGLGKWVQ